ncbi:hypothetical protein [Flavobacterium solisilvae]|uniref:DUF2282 domain-containing protein n=1 Tax=Flavobacterium solisilvae TaxID=1852019 RepID=A0ABX1QTJ8_9FLAO|nr:hypothetical protein [Flavobacterium solisilvae]NMH24383.1 hypothetical protein [Flavobacterium solisilvae]
MKKLFFSAVALVAFSSVSMAENTVNVSKEDKTAGTVSCTRRVTNTCPDGTVNSSSATASVPSSGDYEVDRGKACDKAKAQATLSANTCL